MPYSLLSPSLPPSSLSLSPSPSPPSLSIHSSLAPSLPRSLSPSRLQAFRAASQGADPSAIASAAHQQGMVFTRQDPLFELGGLGHAGDISIDPSPLVQGSGDARARDRSFCAAAMAAPSPQQGMMSQDSFDLSLADFGECSTPTAPMATAFVLPDPPQ